MRVATPADRGPALCAAGLVHSAEFGAWASDARDTAPGSNVLIADQFNNRVLEVGRSTHRIVWQFGNGSDQPGPASVVAVNDAERGFDRLGEPYARLAMPN